MIKPRVIAELCRNHLGDMVMAKKMIAKAAECGVWAVKIQVRDIDACYSAEKLAEKRDSPFGRTYEQYARACEFDLTQINELAEYAHNLNLAFGFSVWDQFGAVRARSCNPSFIKIPSALAHNIDFIKAMHKVYASTPMHVSTGACKIDDVDAIRNELFRLQDVIYHCTCSYPMEPADANLAIIEEYRRRYPGKIIGYSDHSRGIHLAVMAATLGAVYIEKHFTLDRTMYGSDQSSSIEPDGLRRLCRNLDECAKAYGKTEKKVLAIEVHNLKRITGNG